MGVAGLRTSLLLGALACLAVSTHNGYPTDPTHVAEPSAHVPPQTITGGRGIRDTATKENLSEGVTTGSTGGSSGEKNTHACVSFGFGAMMKKTHGTCSLTEEADCKVPEGMTGGGKMLYADTTCADALEQHDVARGAVIAKPAAQTDIGGGNDKSNRMADMLSTIEKRLTEQTQAYRNQWEKSKHEEERKTTAKITQAEHALNRKLSPTTETLGSAMKHVNTTVHEIRHWQDEIKKHNRTMSINRIKVRTLVHRLQRFHEDAYGDADIAKEVSDIDTQYHKATAKTLRRAFLLSKDDGEKSSEASIEGPSINQMTMEAGTANLETTKKVRGMVFQLVALRAQDEARAQAKREHDEERRKKAEALANGEAMTGEEHRKAREATLATAKAALLQAEKDKITAETDASKQEIDSTKKQLVVERKKDEARTAEKEVALTNEKNLLDREKEDLEKKEKMVAAKEEQADTRRGVTATESAALLVQKADIQEKKDAFKMEQAAAVSHEQAQAEATIALATQHQVEVASRRDR